MTAFNTDFIQVIEYLDNGKIRVFNIVDSHEQDEEDALSTIIIKGYKDINP